MRKLLMALALVLLAANLAFAADKEMRLFIWSEYMPEDFVPNFEKQTGIKVRVDYYESMEEMIAKLQAGGVSQYDVVVPSDYVIPTMVKLDLLKELDHAKIPNMKNLASTFVNPPYDPGNKYTAAYQWGTLGMMYKKDKVPGNPPSWAVMFDESKQLGPFVLIDSTREMLGCALAYMGKDVNTTDKKDLDALAALMLKVKKSKYFQGFEVGTGARSKVVAGAAIAAIVYNGDGLRPWPRTRPRPSPTRPRARSCGWTTCASPRRPRTPKPPTSSSTTCWTPRPAPRSPTGPSTPRPTRPPWPSSIPTT